MPVDNSIDFSIDVDLKIATGFGSISIENKQPSYLVIRISDSKTLREVIRKQQLLREFLETEFGKMVSQSLAVDVQLIESTIAEFKKGKLAKGRRIYLFWQYIMAKLGL